MNAADQCVRRASQWLNNGPNVLANGGQQRQIDEDEVDEFMRSAMLTGQGARHLPNATRLV